VYRPRRLRPTRATRCTRPAPAARVRAALYLLVAAALFFAQAAKLSHYLIATHTLCEHGELLEAPEQTKHAKSASKASDLERDTQGVENDEGTTRASEHEHCDALAIHHIESRFAIPIPEPTLLCVLAPQSIDEARGERPIALLSLAPKSSPPLASV